MNGQPSLGQTIQRSTVTYDPSEDESWFVESFILGTSAGTWDDAPGAVWPRLTPRPFARRPRRESQAEGRGGAWLSVDHTGRVKRAPSPEGLPPLGLFLEGVYDVANGMVIWVRQEEGRKCKETRQSETREVLWRHSKKYYRDWNKYGQRPKLQSSVVPHYIMLIGTLSVALQ